MLIYRWVGYFVSGSPSPPSSSNETGYYYYMASFRCVSKCLWESETILSHSTANQQAIVYLPAGFVDVHRLQRVILIFRGKSNVARNVTHTPSFFHCRTVDQAVVVVVVDQYAE